MGDEDNNKYACVNTKKKPAGDDSADFCSFVYYYLRQAYTTLPFIKIFITLDVIHSLPLDTEITPRMVGQLLINYVTCVNCWN